MLTAGSHLGPYEIVAPIGAGGMMWTRAAAIVKRTLTPFSVLIIVVQFGCSTLGTSQRAPDAQHPIALQRVTVVAAGEEPKVEFLELTRNRAEGASTVSGAIFSNCFVPIGSGDAGLFYTILGAVVCGSASGVGAMAGAAVGVPSSKSIAGPATAVRLRDLLRDDVASAATMKGVQVVTVPSATADEVVRRSDYGAFAAAGIDTVVEVTVTSVGARSGRGARFSLVMRAHARVVRTADSRQLFVSDYVHEAEKLTLSQWSANEGERLRMALKTGCEILGSRIVNSIVVPDSRP